MKNPTDFPVKILWRKRDFYWKYLQKIHSFSRRGWNSAIFCTLSKWINREITVTNLNSPEDHFYLVLLFCTIKRIINKQSFTFLINYFVKQLFWWTLIFFWQFTCYWHRTVFIGSIHFFINNTPIWHFHIKFKLLLCTFVLFVALTNLHLMSLGCFVSSLAVYNLSRVLSFYMLVTIEVIFL